MTYGCDAPPDQLDPAAPHGQLPGRVLHVGPGGIRTLRCPRAWAVDLVATSAWPEYLWWDKGQLGPRGELPERLVNAIDVLHLSFSLAQRVHQKRERERRERAGRKQNNGPGRR